MPKKHKNKPRPYIVESQWKEGTISKNWRFFKNFATEAAAVDAVGVALSRASFRQYRLLFKGELQWIKP